MLTIPGTETSQSPRVDDLATLDLSPFEYGAILTAATETFTTYQAWANDNPELVEAHIKRYVGHLETASGERRLTRRIGALVTGRTTDLKTERLAEEARFFGIVNLGELITPERERQIVEEAKGLKESFRLRNGSINSDGKGSITERISAAFPEV